MPVRQVPYLPVLASLWVMAAQAPGHAVRRQASKARQAGGGARIRVKCEVLLLQTLSLLSSFSRHFVVHKPRLPQLATLDPAFNGRRLVARRQQLRLRPIAFDRAPTGIEPELMGMRPARES